VASSRSCRSIFDTSNLMYLSRKSKFAFCEDGTLTVRRGCQCCGSTKTRNYLTEQSLNIIHTHTKTATNKSINEQCKALTAARKQRVPCHQITLDLRSLFTLRASGSVDPFLTRDSKTLMTISPTRMIQEVNIFISRPTSKHRLLGVEKQLRPCRSSGSGGAVAKRNAFSLGPCIVEGLRHRRNISADAWIWM
jgi:hypothetical protein